MGKKKSKGSNLGVYGPALIIAVVGFVLAYQFVGPPPPKQITIATGSPEGAYHAFANRYAPFLDKAGIELVIRETAGTEENLSLLRDDSAPVDVAFVQGGVATVSAEDALLGLASLYYEPLWIICQKRLPIKGLADFAGRSVAIGKSGSGTRAIASALLAANGVTSDNATLINGGGESVLRPLEKGVLDAVFTVASIDSPLVQKLLSNPDYVLLDMRRAAAYTRTYRFLSTIVLPEGLIDLEANRPDHDVRLLAPVATLVARDDMHPALVDLLLQAAREVHAVPDKLHEPGQFPSPRFMEFPLSEDAERYFEYGPPFLQRYLPFWIATLIDRLKVMLLPLVMLLIPIFKIVPPTLRWKTRKKIYRWYKDLQGIDAGLDDSPGAEEVAACSSQLDRIESEVTQVSVPLSYTDQLYNLRLHISLIRQKLEGLCPTKPRGA